MKKNMTLKNWLKKVQNYYNGVRYVMENKLKLKPLIDEDFLNDLVEFFNKLFFADNQFLWFYIEYYCKGKTLEEIAYSVGYSVRHVSRINNKFLKWADNNFNSKSC